MVSRPTFLRERLSVVSAWSNSAALQKPYSKPYQQEGALFLAE